MSWKDEIIEAMPIREEITVQEIVAKIRPGLSVYDQRIAYNKAYSILKKQIKWGTVQMVGFKRNENNLKVSVWMRM